MAHHTTPKSDSMVRVAGVWSQLPEMGVPWGSGASPGGLVLHYNHRRASARGDEGSPHQRGYKVS